MANIRKSFNFRSGLQVDNDNFVINENGLVGIGTSAPSLYKLNIYGDTRNTGLVTTSELYAGVGTISNFEATNANITGVLTATQLSLGGQLVGSNLVGSADTTWIISPGGVGLHTLSSVGVGTTAKSQYILDALGNVNITGDLDAVGNANITGVLTAGNVNITGDITGDLDALGNVNITGDLDAVGNANITGVLTAGNVNITGDLDALGNVNITGVLTATNLSGTLAATNISGILSNNQLPSSISASFTGDLTGTATTATKLENSRDFSVSGDVATSSAVGFAGTDDVNLAVTLSSDFNANTSGIITANQIHSSTTLYGVDLSLSGADSSIEVNGSNSASISIGNTEVGVGNSYASFRYSNRNLNISNYDIGDINSYLQVGGSGLTTGRFNWYDGDTNALLMALTHEGKLGIGRTDPVETFEVVGTSTVTSDSYIGNNLSVGGDLSVFGEISAGTISLDEITSNVNVTTGISTFAEIHVFGGVSSKIGIGTDSPDVGLDARSETAKFNTVAINTTSTNYSLNVGGSGNFLLNIKAEKGFYSSGSNPVQIYVDGTNLIFNVVGVGSTSFLLS